MIEMMLALVVGAAAGWLGRGGYIYARARKDHDYTIVEAIKLVVRGSRV